MRPKDRKTLLISGSFIAVLSVVATISIFMLGKEHGLFESKFNLHTKVINAQNLKPGAAVQLKGIKVGSVSSIDITGINEIKISLSILGKYQQWIKTDSYVAFKNQGVLGDKFLEILGGSETAVALEQNAHIPSQENSQLDKFIDKGENILEVVGDILHKMDAVLASIRADRFDNIMSNIEKTTHNANILISQLNAMEFNKLSKSLNQSTQSLEDVSTRIKQGPGTLHSLIYDRSIHDDLRSLLGGAQRNKILRYFIQESIKKNEQPKK